MTTDPSTPPPSHLHKSPLLRLGKWLFSWRVGRWFLLGPALLISLAVLVLSLIDWSGKRQWEAYKQQLSARGGTVNLAKLIPPPVPDELNFAATPLLAACLDLTRTPTGMVRHAEATYTRALKINLPGNGNAARLPAWRDNQPGRLADWQKHFRSLSNQPPNSVPRPPAQDVLQALSGFKNDLAELQAASQRPQARHAIRYEDGIQTLLPHLSVIRGISRVLSLRALAHLELEQPDRAMADLRLLHRLGESVKGEPLLISQLVRIACTETILSSLWQGCVQHQWKEAQLREFQQMLAEVNFLESYSLALQGERAGGTAAMDDPKLLFQEIQMADGNTSGPTPPPGAMRYFPWKHQNQLFLSRAMDACAFPMASAKEHRVYPDQAANYDHYVETHMRGFNPGTLLARMLLPALAKTARRFAAAQSGVDMATLACALERYRLANGRYPQDLKSLTPTLLKSIPTDVVSEVPLRYVPGTNGDSFTVYSVGWNGVDDGGKVVFLDKKHQSNLDLEQGDWVWQFPAPTGR
jgi:hypothetical protein